jgi:hypothetical protein
MPGATARQIKPAPAIKRTPATLHSVQSFLTIFRMPFTARGVTVKIATRRIIDSL